MSRINSINTARHNIDLTKTNKSMFHIKLEILFFAVFQVHGEILSMSFRVKREGNTHPQELLTCSWFCCRVLVLWCCYRHQWQTHRLRESRTRRTSLIIHSLSSVWRDNSGRGPGEWFRDRKEYIKTVEESSNSVGHRRHAGQLIKEASFRIGSILRPMDEEAVREPYQMMVDW